MEFTVTFDQIKSTLETHNFQFYIGSHAVITDEKLAKGTPISGWDCTYFIGLCKSHFGGEMLVLIDNGTGDSHECFLDDCHLVLRPLKSMTQAEMKQYHKLYKLRNNMSHEEPWWVKDLDTMQTNNAQFLWLIKNGFDVGLIPDHKRILTTDFKPKFKLQKA